MRLYSYSIFGSSREVLPAIRNGLQPLEWSGNVDRRNAAKEFTWNSLRGVCLFPDLDVGRALEEGRADRKPAPELL